MLFTLQYREVGNCPELLGPNDNWQGAQFDEVPQVIQDRLISLLDGEVQVDRVYDVRNGSGTIQYKLRTWYHEPTPKWVGVRQKIKA